MSTPIPLRAPEYWGSAVFMGRRARHRLISADYTIGYEDNIIGVNTAAARTVTLASSEALKGRFLVIKDESGTAATNNITVATEGAETIDGSASNDTINTNYGARGYYSDGSNWFKI